MALIISQYRLANLPGRGGVVAVPECDVCAGNSTTPVAIVNGGPKGFPSVSRMNSEKSRHERRPSPLLQLQEMGTEQCGMVDYLTR